MYFKKKYQLSTLIAMSLLAVACADDPDDLSSGDRMEFTVGTEVPVSRSNSGGLSQFAVFGDMKNIETEQTTIILNNVPVTFNSTNNSWEYSGTQYWFPDYEHSFVAIHPASVLTTEANINYTNNQLSFTYTLPSDLTQTADILSATHRRHYTDNRKKDENGKTTGAAEAVSLRFGHMMTQINITASVNDNIMGDNGYLEFLKFEMSGFKSKAEFVIRPASLQTNNQTDDREITISVAEGEATGNMTIAFTEPVKVANGTSGQLFSSSEDAIVMVPQEFAEDSKAQIILTYKASNESAAKQITLPLKGLKWESGKSYNYRFTMGKSGPHFDGTTITNWEILNAGNFVTR